MKKPRNITKPVAALFIVTACLGAGCVNQPVPGASHFNKGVELYDDGKYADSMEEYKLALRRNPVDTFAKYNLAVVYQDKGKTEEALRLYREILKSVEDTNSRINIAAIYYGRGDEEAAFAELRKAAEANPDNPNPPSILGEYLERKNRFREAAENYRKALARDGRHAPTHYRLGRLLLKEGRSPEGAGRLRRAIELDDEVPEYLTALAAEYQRLEKPLEAIALLERVSVLQPGRAEVFIHLGDLYRQSGFYKEAVQRYWTSLSIKDDDPQVHRRLKEIFDHLSKYEKDWLEQSRKQGTVASTQ